MDQNFLPMTNEEIIIRGWDQPDFVLISGDAYVDHPSFGAAIIGRYLEAYGFRIGIIAQPDWKNPQEFKKLGKPALGYLVTAGNIDSMVNHYSVAKKKRKTDAYSPGGKTGLRPDRATAVYARMARKAYPDVPVILGGIEASLRRMAHYDYWKDRLLPSILVESGADLLVYGMGEKAILEVAEALKSGLSIRDITYVRGTAYCSKHIDNPEETIFLPSFKEATSLKEKFARSFAVQQYHTEAQSAKTLAEKYDHAYVIQTPPAYPLSTEEMDIIYRLPFQRTYHPFYEKSGGVPAIAEVKFSLVSSRGCFGGCSFCALHFHQGRTVQSRSIEAIVEEAEIITGDPSFKGYIHDVGGPTANFRQKACSLQEKRGTCPDRLCLFPKPCPNLKVDHSDYLALLRRLRKLPGVKKVFIRSGIRHDYLLYDQDSTFFEELCRYHISGQLKIAPEHVSPPVLDIMRKPDKKVYLDFKKKYKYINRELNLDQYLVPYFMSSHPGTDLEAAVELARFINKYEHVPRQVQDFYPTPGTLSTCMFYTGLDPHTMKKVYIPRSAHEKAMQRALIQYKNPKIYNLVYEALQKTGRTDLIGFAKKCLIKPRRKTKKEKNRQNKNKASSGGFKNIRQR